MLVVRAVKICVNRLTNPRLEELKEIPVMHRDAALNPENLKAQACYFSPRLEADKSERRPRNSSLE